MESGLKLNTTSTGSVISLPPFMAGWFIQDVSQRPVTVGAVTILAAILSFLALQLYRPAVHPKSPAFTSDTIPILGSFGFVIRQW
jgi:hypothetical protein